MLLPTPDVDVDDGRRSLTWVAGSLPSCCVNGALLLLPLDMDGITVPLSSSLVMLSWSSSEPSGMSESLLSGSNMMMMMMMMMMNDVVACTIEREVCVILLLSLAHCVESECVHTAPVRNEFWSQIY